jgi:hypothetical protein
VLIGVVCFLGNGARGGDIRKGLFLFSLVLIFFAVNGVGRARLVSRYRESRRRGVPLSDERVISEARQLYVVAGFVTVVAAFLEIAFLSFKP